MNNTHLTIALSAARTATLTVPVNNAGHSGGILVIVVSAIAANAIVQPIIQIMDEIGNYQTYWQVATATGIAATGTFIYVIYPGAAPAGVYTPPAGGAGPKEIVSLPLPRDFQVVLFKGEANSITYSARLHWVV